jgi:adenylyl-sulfate kinase
MIKPSNGFVLWLTGLPCSGKTTIAKELVEIIKRDFPHQYIERLDGDVIRQDLTRDLGFSKEDRDMNIDRVAFVSDILSRNGVGVISAFVSPYILHRENVKKRVTNFIEVHVNAPLEICEQRDVKGMYKKAREGLIKDFTGIDDPYEAPMNPDLEIRTHEEDISESVQKCINILIERKLLI